MKNLLNKLFSPQGKNILITGSNGQLGSLLCSSFLESEANVIGVDIHDSSEKISGVDYYKTDITINHDVTNFFNHLYKKYGHIDVLINNAGVAVFNPFLERTDSELDFVFNVNLKGTFFCIKNYVKQFRESHQKHGSIINIASIFGVVSPDFRNYTDCARNSSEIYGATKAGVIQMTRYFATHLAKDEIRVNCISPGGILNEQSPQGEDFQTNYGSRCPMGRLANAEEMVGAAFYLAGNGSTYTTGQNIVIDGGMSSW